MYLERQRTKGHLQELPFTPGEEKADEEKPGGHLLGKDSKELTHKPTPKRLHPTPTSREQEREIYSGYPCSRLAVSISCFQPHYSSRYIRNNERSYRFVYFPGDFQNKMASERLSIFSS